MPSFKPGAVFLIIHRLPFSRRQLVEGLGKRGFVTAAAASLAEARAKLLKAEGSEPAAPDCIILDPGSVGDQDLAALAAFEVPIGLDVDARIDAESLRAEVARTGAIAAAARGEVSSLLAALESPSDPVRLAMSEQRAAIVEYVRKSDQQRRKEEARITGARTLEDYLALDTEALLEAMGRHSIDRKMRGIASSVDEAVVQIGRFIEETKLATDWSFFFEANAPIAEQYAQALEQLDLRDYGTAIRKVAAIWSSDSAAAAVEALLRETPLSLDRIGQGIRQWLRAKPIAVSVEEGLVDSLEDAGGQRLDDLILRSCHRRRAPEDPGWPSLGAEFESRPSRRGPGRKIHWHHFGKASSMRSRWSGT